MPEEKSDALVMGRELLNFSRVAEGKVRYGRITELFPYIYEASKRIGIRAISRWLSEQGQPVSHSTISRALANSEEHWEALARQIEPHARLLKEGFGFPNYDFLFGPATPTGLGVPEEFSALVCKIYYERQAAGVETTDEELRRKVVAEPCEKYLGQVWYVLSEETREHCRKYFTNIDAENKK
jgi:hypothetical protein